MSKIYVGVVKIYINQETELSSLFALVAIVAHVMIQIHSVPTNILLVIISCNPKKSIF